MTSKWLNVYIYKGKCIGSQWKLVGVPCHFCSSTFSNILWLDRPLNNSTVFLVASTPFKLEGDILFVLALESPKLKASLCLFLSCNWLVFLNGKINTTSTDINYLVVNSFFSLLHPVPDNVFAA